MTITKAAQQAIDALEQALPELCIEHMSDAKGAIKALRAALQDKAVEVPADGWQKLDKPATVGAGTFGVGVSSRLVVEAAQRAYQYKRENAACTKEEMQADEARRRSVWDMIHGAPSAQPAPVVPDGFALVPVEPTEAERDKGTP